MTPGGSIIFRPVNTDLDVRCEATWGGDRETIWVVVYERYGYLDNRLRELWLYCGGRHMRSLARIQDVLAEYGMPPDDIARVNWRRANA